MRGIITTMVYENGDLFFNTYASYNSLIQYQIKNEQPKHCEECRKNRGYNFSVSSIEKILVIVLS